MYREINLFEEPEEGLFIPYRAKKAHYFREGISLCKKHKLPKNAVLSGLGLCYKSEICKECYDKLMKSRKLKL